jgi:hypothetical protein
MNGAGIAGSSMPLADGDLVPQVGQRNAGAELRD